MKGNKPSVTYTIQLSEQDHAFVLIGLQTIRWGGDPRVDPLYEKLHERLGERNPEVLRGLINAGFVEPLDSFAIRRLKEKIAELQAAETTS